MSKIRILWPKEKAERLLRRLGLEFDRSYNSVEIGYIRMDFKWIRSSRVETEWIRVDICSTGIECIGLVIDG